MWKVDPKPHGVGYREIGLTSVFGTVRVAVIMSNGTTVSSKIVVSF